MKITKLQNYTSPELGDILPIVDLDGGINGKPQTKRITVENLLSLASPTSNFEIPTTIKTTADSGDYFIGIDANGLLYKITKANLLAGLSSGGSSNEQTNFTYSSGGDTNGLLYYLGTNNNTASFRNPATNGAIITSQSSYFSNDTKADKLTDRLYTNYPFHTQRETNPWAKIDLGNTRLFLCNLYSIKARSDFADDSNHLRSWKFQGSNDDTNWTDLDIQTNRTDFTIGAWLAIPLSSNSTGYRYFRIMQTGLNSSNDTYMTLGEIELYGSIVSSNSNNRLLLIRGSGSNNSVNITDLSQYANTLTLVGDTKISTTQNPFNNGTGSIYFDGSGDRITVNNSNFQVHQNDFCFEMFAYWESISGEPGIFQLSDVIGGLKQGYANSLGVAAILSGGTYKWFYFANGNYHSTSTIITPQTWYYVALKRVKGVTSLGVNGNQIASVADTTDYTAQHLCVGGYYDTGFLGNIRLSNFRFSNINVDVSAIPTTNF